MCKQMVASQQEVSSVTYLGTDYTGATTMDSWKQGLVAPKAAATELFVAGLAQWVYFVCDRWQEKSLFVHSVTEEFFYFIVCENFRYISKR
jgi:hypothetical protein